MTTVTSNPNSFATATETNCGLVIGYNATWGGAFLEIDNNNAYNFAAPVGESRATLSSTSGES